MQHIKIISIDHGTCTGWSFFTLSEVNEKDLKDFGYFKVPSAPERMTNRLLCMKQGICSLYDAIKPQIAVLERPMSFVNADATRMLIAYYSLAMACAAERGIYVIDVFPTAVKKAITGSGASKKETVADTIIQRFDINPAKVTPLVNNKPIYDITDSIANCLHVLESKRITFTKVEDIL